MLTRALRLLSAMAPLRFLSQSLELKTKCHFTCVESLGKFSGRAHFDAPNAHESCKSIRRKPLLVPLGSKTRHQVFYLALASLAIKRNIEIGRAQVAIILWNLIFEDHVIPPGVPGQLVDDPVVLMQILSRMSKDHVRRSLGLQLFEV